MQIKGINNINLINTRNNKDVTRVNPLDKNKNAKKKKNYYFRKRIDLNLNGLIRLWMENKNKGLLNAKNNMLLIACMYQIKNK